MKEQIVTGKKFRILADVTSRLWHVISFWTKAQDVEFNDGTNAQSKLGNIVGISDSLTSTASNVAASAKAVKIINDKVVNQIGNLNNQIGNLNNQISIAQEGFDAIYNALVSAGSTPSGKSPADLVASVNTMTQKYFWCDVTISGSGDFGAGNSVSAKCTIQGTEVVSVRGSGNGASKTVNVTLAAVEYYLIPVDPSDARYSNKVTVTINIGTGKDQGNGDTGGQVTINGVEVVRGSGKNYNGYSAHQTKVFKLVNNTLTMV